MNLLRACRLDFHYSLHIVFRMDSKILVETLAKRMNRKREDVEKLLDAFISTVKNRCGELDSVEHLRPRKDLSEYRSILQRAKGC